MNSVQLWMASKRPLSRWRQRARFVIQEVVEILLQSAPEVLADHTETLSRVDAAYPFGERRYEPYRCWLKERRLFIAALEGPVQMPTRDEAEVCEVAGDLVQLGRIDEARKLLEEQAPNRLGRKCPACGMPPGMNCNTFVDDGDPPARELLVPHHARLVGHLDAGPLFARREEP